MIKTLYPSFQRWSDGGRIIIISDTHFGDADCKYMDKDWPCPIKHINRIKKSINKNDTLIHLGDVGDPRFIKRIPAKHKVLILGNHDLGASRYNEYFDEIYTGPLFIAEKILLSHEPIDLPFALNIHGHDHNKSNIGDYNHLNLAANVVDYYAISLGEVIKNGRLANIDSIHRITINQATVDKKNNAVYNNK